MKVIPTAVVVVATVDEIVVETIKIAVVETGVRHWRNLIRSASSETTNQ